MNTLSFEKRCAVARCLVDGVSIRATVRITGVAKNTIQKFTRDLGQACLEYQDQVLQNLPCKRIQCDELYATASWLYFATAVMNASLCLALLLWQAMSTLKRRPLGEGIELVAAGGLCLAIAAAISMTKAGCWRRWARRIPQLRAGPPTS